jgi:nicotinamide-nucleotide amidase
VSSVAAEATDAAEAVLAVLEGETTIVTAESLTGGLLAAAFTSVPGSSAHYAGGVVAYATRLKATLLGVPITTLDRDGAVAATTAEAMAIGVRERMTATYGLATTGVAGPDPQEGKPVGLVYVAVAGPNWRVTERHVLAGTREEIQSRTVLAALRLARRRLEQAQRGTQG